MQSPQGARGEGGYGPRSDYGAGTAMSQRDPRAGQGGGAATRAAGTAATPYGSYGYSSPFALMRRLSDEMDRMFESFGLGGSLFGREGASPLGLGATGGGQGGGLPQLWSPHLEVCQRGDKLLIQVDLPGVRKEDVAVQIDQDEVVIQGQRRQEHETSERGFYHSERSYGSFYRTVPLPDGTDAENARATFRDGVLEIELDAPRQRQRGRTLQIQDAGTSAGGASTYEGSTRGTATEGGTTTGASTGRTTSATGVSGGGSTGGSAGSV
jgi:HSP20 family protein